MQNRTKKKTSAKRSKQSTAEAREYPAVIAWSDEDKCFVARVPALLGCASHGDTVEEAAHNIMEAAEGWLETAAAEGIAIPDPPRGMSGKLLVRVPKSLHEGIARRAEIDGVSINHWVVAALARAEGRA